MMAVQVDGCGDRKRGSRLGDGINKFGMASIVQEGIK